MNTETIVFGYLDIVFGKITFSQWIAKFFNNDMYAACRWIERMIDNGVKLPSLPKNV
jgi:hypothetical protein